MAWCPGCGGICDEIYAGTAEFCPDAGTRVTIAAGDPPPLPRISSIRSVVYGGTFPVADTPKVDDRYPHKCPTCGGRAYIGLSSVEHEGLPCRR